ncbi:MAG: hypothetical protein ABGZ36_16400 [Actinomycetota bacterium]
MRSDRNTGVHAEGDAREVGAPPADGADPGSTIVDATSLHLPEGRLRILRQGVISAEELARIVGTERLA